MLQQDLRLLNNFAMVANLNNVMLKYQALNSCLTCSSKKINSTYIRMAKSLWLVRAVKDVPKNVNVVLLCISMSFCLFFRNNQSLYVYEVRRIWFIRFFRLWIFWHKFDVRTMLSVFELKVIVKNATFDKQKKIT